MDTETRRICKEVGKRIKVQRENRAVTQAQLAESVGRSERTIERYEAGTQAADLKTLYRIADVLHVGISKLVAPPGEWQ